MMLRFISSDVPMKYVQIKWTIYKPVNIF